MAKFKTLLICFLIVLLLASGGYILYIKLGETKQTTSEISSEEIKTTLSAFHKDLKARTETASGLSSTVSDSSKIHTVANGLSLNLLDASDAKNDLGIRKSLYSSTIDTETDDGRNDRRQRRFCKYNKVNDQQLDVNRCSSDNCNIDIRNPVQDS